MREDSKEEGERRGERVFVRGRTVARRPKEGKTVVHILARENTALSKKRRKERSCRPVVDKGRYSASRNKEMSGHRREFLIPLRGLKEQTG